MCVCVCVSECVAWNVEPWNRGTVEPWNFGTVELWNLGTVEPCNVERRHAFGQTLLSQTRTAMSKTIQT